MKFNSQIVASAFLAAIVADATSASAAATVKINMEYIGSTTNNSSAATRIAQNTGTGLLLNTTNAPGGDLTLVTAGLTKMTLFDPGVQGMTNLKNYFALYLEYTPNASTDRFLGVGFDIHMPTGMAPVTGNNVSDLTTNKFLTFNPVDDNTGAATWETIGDFGDNGGDMVGMDFAMITADNAYQMNIGTPDALGYDNAGYVSGKGTLLGVFALKFTQIGVYGHVSAAGTTGNTAWWTANDQNAYVIDDSAYRLSPAAGIPISLDPEPASLGMLALGSAALLIRRKRC